MLRTFAQVGQSPTSLYLREKSISPHINSKNETKRDQYASKRIFRVVSWPAGEKSAMFNPFTDRWILWYFLQFFGQRYHLVQQAKKHSVVSAVSSRYFYLF